MTPDKLRELASEVEALQKPSREMDEKIAIRLGLLSEHDSVFDLGGNYLNRSKPYSHSLDAAYSLIPEGKMIVIVYDLEAYAVSLATREEMGLSSKPVSAKTLPLAIVAAALRAIAHERETT